MPALFILSQNASFRHEIVNIKKATSEKSLDPLFGIQHDSLMPKPLGK